MSLVTKRRVFYISGFDPRGADAYHRLFRDQCALQAALLGVDISVGPRSHAGRLSGLWQATHVANVVTQTTFEYLRWDDIVRRHWRGSRWQLFTSALRTYAQSVSPRSRGYLMRILRLSRWNFLLGMSPAIVLFMIPLLAALLGWAGFRLGAYLPLAAPWPSLLLAVAGAGGALAAAAWVERAASIGWLLRSFSFMREYCDGAITDLDPRIDEFTRRFVDYVADSKDDEIIVVGHSSGANIAVSMLSRAMALDPHLLQHTPQVCLLTLGATIPMQGLIAWAHAFRDELQRVAAAGDLPWVDISSPHDIASFALHNPVTASGVTVNGAPAQRPLVVSGAFSEVLSPRTLARAKYNVFRMHFQYLMAGEKPRANDYFSVTTDAQRFATRFQKRAP